MDDRGRMKEHLNRLTCAELTRFFERVHRRPIFGFHSMTPSVKSELIDVILAWREEQTLDWKRACEDAGIDNE